MKAFVSVFGKSLERIQNAAMRFVCAEHSQRHGA